MVAEGRLANTDRDGHRSVPLINTTSATLGGVMENKRLH